MSFVSITIINIKSNLYLEKNTPIFFENFEISLTIFNSVLPVKLKLYEITFFLLDFLLSKKFKLFLFLLKIK